MDDLNIKKEILELRKDLLENQGMLKKICDAIERERKDKDVLITEYIKQRAEAGEKINYNTVRNRYVTKESAGRYYVTLDFMGNPIIKPSN